MQFSIIDCNKKVNKIHIIFCLCVDGYKDRIPIFESDILFFHTPMLSHLLEQSIDYYRYVRTLQSINKTCKENK